MLLHTLYIHSVRRRKRYTIVCLTDDGNIFCCARLLTAKIISRETQDYYLVSIFFIEFLPVSILLGESTFGGYIQNDQFFTFVFGKINHFVSFQLLKLEVMYRPFSYVSCVVFRFC